MKKFLKNFFWLSFAFFLISHFTTKYINHTYLHHGLWRAFASLPVEFWDGRDNVKMQIYAASEEEVVKILKENPRDPKFLPIHNSTVLQGNVRPPAYVILRFKNSRSWSKWGDVKCYCSGFPYPITNFIVAPSRSAHYHDIIFPYPASLDDRIEENYTIKARWKNFWGL